MTTQLIEVGQALYGNRWRKDMAFNLGVSERTVRRWVKAGDMPKRYSGQLLSLIKERQLLIEQLLQEFIYL